MISIIMRELYIVKKASKLFAIFPNNTNNIYLSYLKPEINPKHQIKFSLHFLLGMDILLIFFIASNCYDLTNQALS